MPCLIPEYKTAHCGLAILIQHLEFYLNCRSDFKQQRHFTAKSKVLCPLANIKRKIDFPHSSFTAVNQKNGVFHLQSAKSWHKRRSGEYFAMKELILCAGNFTRTPTGINRPHLRRTNFKRTRNLGLVDHLNQKRGISMLLNRSFRFAAGSLNPRFRIDININKRQRIEYLLYLSCVTNFASLLQPFQGVFIQGRAKKLKSIHQPDCLRSKRLPLNLHNLISTQRCSQKQQDANRSQHRLVSFKHRLISCKIHFRSTCSLIKTNYLPFSGAASAGINLICLTSMTAPLAFLIALISKEYLPSFAISTSPTIRGLNI